MITRSGRGLLSVLAAIVATACTPEPPADAETVVLVHGLGRTPASMLVLETRLAGAGYRVVNFGYPSRSEPLEALTDSLEDAVRECSLCRDHDVRILIDDLDRHSTERTWHRV